MLWEHSHYRLDQNQHFTSLYDEAVCQRIKERKRKRDVCRQTDQKNNTKPTLKSHCGPCAPPWLLWSFMKIDLCSAVSLHTVCVCVCVVLMRAFSNLCSTSSKHCRMNPNLEATKKWLKQLFIFIPMFTLHEVHILNFCFTHYNISNGRIWMIYQFV